MNIIEAIAKRIAANEKTTVSEWHRSTAQAIWNDLLNLHYKCKECTGTGRSGALDLKSGYHAEWKCESCKGTGLSPNKILAVLDEKQEVPKSPYRDDAKLASVEYYESNAYWKAQQDMIKAGWKKTREVEA